MQWGNYTKDACMHNQQKQTNKKSVRSRNQCMRSSQQLILFQVSFGAPRASDPNECEQVRQKTTHGSLHFCLMTLQIWIAVIACTRFHTTVFFN